MEGYHAPGGVDVLPAVGIDPAKVPGYPDISGVKANGKFADVFDHDTSEIRHDIPGDLNRCYDRKSLQMQVTQKRMAAGGQPKQS